MDRIRTRTANLFYISGALHLVYVLFLVFLLFRPLDASLVVTTVFGVAFLALGYYLTRGGMTIILLGLIAAVLGLLMNVAGMFLQFHYMSIVFLVLDIAMIASCVYIYTRTKRPYKTV